MREVRSQIFHLTRGHPHGQYLENGLRGPPRAHGVTGSQVIMIDPNGKKYTRKEMVQMAAGMAASFGEKGLPDGFCAISYKQGVDEGGKFPAGRAAFMEACQEGVKLAS